MTAIVAVANNKGGTGKTTTTQFVGELLARSGWVTALIDLDGQANLTSAYEMADWNTEENPGIAQVIRNQHPIAAALYPVADNLYLCPASPSLNDVADEISTKPLQLFRLRTALEGIQADVVLIDCPPNLGSLTYAALIASQWLIIPVEPLGWAIDGLQRTLEKLTEIQREIGSAPTALGAVATKIRSDLTAHRISLAVLHRLGIPILAEIPRREGMDARKQLEIAYQPVAAAIASLLKA